MAKHNLPLSADPALHVGDRSYSIAKVGRGRHDGMVESRITDWETLPGSVPLVLGAAGRPRHPSRKHTA